MPVGGQGNKGAESLASLLLRSAVGSLSGLLNQTLIAENLCLHTDLTAGGDLWHIVEQVQHDGGASMGCSWIIIGNIQHEAVAPLGHLLCICYLRHPANIFKVC